MEGINYCSMDYPFQLALCPLVSAVAAGNQVVLKPSELTGNTSAIISKITKTFHTNHVEVVQGGVDVSQNLLAQRWDYIFLQEVLLEKRRQQNILPCHIRTWQKPLY
jgi:acyl-CoA reductase-like NAD-dependent aldehyde dehydrogenase